MHKNGLGLYEDLKAQREAVIKQLREDLKVAERDTGEARAGLRNAEAREREIQDAIKELEAPTKGVGRG